MAVFSVKHCQIWEVLAVPLTKNQIRHKRAMAKIRNQRVIRNLNDLQRQLRLAEHKLRLLRK